MKSFLSGFIALFSVVVGLQSTAHAGPDGSGSRTPRTSSFGLVSEVNVALVHGALPHVDFTYKMGQWTAQDFANFVRGLPASTKQIQIYSYMDNGLFMTGTFILNNPQLAQKIADFINHEETVHRTRLFSLRPDGLPGYKVEPNLARFHPTYVPASGQVQVAQYQENGEYFALLIESINADGNVVLVNGKTLKKGEFLLAVPQLGDAKLGVTVLRKSKAQHFNGTAVNPGVIYRVFQDGSIQLTNQRHVFSHVDYELPLAQNGELKSGVKIHYSANTHSRELHEGQVAFVYKKHVVLADKESVVAIEKIHAIFPCESYMIPSFVGTDFSHGK